MLYVILPLFITDSKSFNLITIIVYIKKQLLQFSL